MQEGVVLGAPGTVEEARVGESDAVVVVGRGLEF